MNGTQEEQTASSNTVHGSTTRQRTYCTSTDEAFILRLFYTCHTLLLLLAEIGDLGLVVVDAITICYIMNYIVP